MRISKQQTEKPKIIPIKMRALSTAAWCAKKKKIIPLYIRF